MQGISVHVDPITVKVVRGTHVATVSATRSAGIPWIPLSHRAIATQLGISQTPTGGVLRTGRHVSWTLEDPEMRMSSQGVEDQNDRLFRSG